MSPYTKRRFWMSERPQVSSRWCSCCIRRSSFAIIKRLAGVVVLMVVGGELQIQSLPTDRLPPWQTYVLVGCINETLLLSWLHNRVNFTSVIWCVCHSIMIISLYQSYYSLYLFDFILVLGGSDSFLFVEISQKDELILYLFVSDEQTPSTWHDSNALSESSSQVMPSNAGERSEGAGWSWSCVFFSGKNTWIENRQNLSRNQGSEHVSTTRWCFMIWTFWCHVFHIFLNNFAIVDSLVDMLYVLLIDRDS